MFTTNLFSSEIANSVLATLTSYSFSIVFTNNNNTFSLAIYMLIYKGTALLLFQVPQDHKSNNIIMELVLIGGFRAVRAK